MTEYPSNPGATYHRIAGPEPRKQTARRDERGPAVREGWQAQNDQSAFGGQSPKGCPVTVNLDHVLAEDAGSGAGIRESRLEPEALLREGFLVSADVDADADQPEDRQDHEDGDQDPQPVRATVHLDLLWAREKRSLTPALMPGFHAQRRLNPHGLERLLSTLKSTRPRAQNAAGSSSSRPPGHRRRMTGPWSARHP